MTRQNPRLAWILAGGTGGHVFPGLALAATLRARGWNVEWVGSRHGLENRLVPEAGIPLHRLPVVGLRGTGWKRKLLAPWTLGLSLWASLALVLRRRPDVAVAFGGFAAGPAGIMASALSVPLIVHEQNAVPGKTNRWLARVAERVATGFPVAFPKRRRQRVAVLGNPVRAAIEALEPPEQRFAARIDSGHALRLLILGGSLGALRINRAIPAAVARLRAERPVDVWHQSGARTEGETRDGYAAAGLTEGASLRIEPFIDDMAAAWGWADVVVARAGALTVAEVAATGVAALFVPYPHAVDDHQWTNAEELVTAGSAWRIRDDDCTPMAIGDWLTVLRRDDLVDRARRARALHRPAAAERLADWCDELADPATTQTGRGT